MKVSMTKNIDGKDVTMTLTSKNDVSELGFLLMELDCGCKLPITIETMCAAPVRGELELKRMLEAEFNFLEETTKRL